MTYNYDGFNDPTETYEAWKEREAEMQMEEQKEKEFDEKVLEYMRQFTYVDLGEVNGAAQKGYAYALGEDPEEYQLSRGEVLVAQEYAEEYIKRNNIKFDEEGDIIDNPF